MMPLKNTVITIQEIKKLIFTIIHETKYRYKINYYYTKGGRCLQKIN